MLSTIDELGLRPGARVLDVGCGPGLISLALAERGYLVHAIDTVPTMISMARQLAAESNLGNRIRNTICDIRYLGFADNSFDLSIVVGVTEWLDSLDRPISEIRRVLKPGGSVIITGDNTWSLHFVLDPRWNPMFSIPRALARGMLRRLGLRRSSCYHLRTNHQLDSALRGAGFSIIRRMTFGFGPFSFFNKKLFSDSLGLKIHRSLQCLANRNWPVLRSTGHVYIALARS
ncbi:MAG: methylase involved in ubiquinone/menaquinone biosynthesis [Acidobacteriaceae bacterium]|nr:methylase involved in ubiquinone/menaquinone biosynthesis [Acidobacteriaceae bacterium]